MTPRFVTESAGAVVDENDRVAVRRVTRCADCGTVVADKAARDSHKCPVSK